MSNITSIGIMSNDIVGTVRGSKMDFTHNDDITPGYNLQFKDNTPMSPSMFHFTNSNNNIVFISPLRKSTISRIDTETGKILDEFSLRSKEDSDFSIDSITPNKKFSNYLSSSVVSMSGISNSTLFDYSWDTRVKESERNNILQDSQMHEIGGTKYTSIATTKNGDVVVGDIKGSVRLFQSPSVKGLMRAKTLLNQLADPVKAVDTSASGEWVIWTTKEYIAVVNTKFKWKDDEYYTGFTKTMGKYRPDALLLKISDEDMKAHGIEEVNFTKAKFDNGPFIDLNSPNIIEEEIVASTGKYLVRWNLRSVSQAYFNRDKKLKPIIYEQKGNIVDKSFQFNQKSVVAAVEDSLSTLQLNN